jgi:SWI/SNF-related matrix-associated actin-dependent regulator of chromatin subfamily A member 5
LEHLLAQFGAHQSATSATQARRKDGSLSSLQTDSVAGAPRTPTEQTQPKPQQQNVIPELSTFSTSPGPSLDSSNSTEVTSESEDASGSDTVNEQRVSLLPRASLRRARKSHAQLEGLKMEHRRKDRDEAPRRSTRVRKSDILASDTVYYPPTPPSKRKSGAPSPRKLDTARARLRDDIARKTKAKANSFIVANKELFLPLLPPHNYVTRLVANDQSASVQQYKRLSAQPQGVKATMKPYQLDGLSFLVYLHNNGFSGILSDEMGLGKTLQTLSLFQYLEEQDRDLGVVTEESRPYLVICPLSVLNSWVNEAKKVTIRRSI